MATTNYQMIWDPTNKKWTVSIGAAAAIDLEQNIIMAAGSAATPSLRRASDLDTGLYFPAADEIALAAGGKVAFHVKESGNQMNYYLNSEDATSQLQIDVLDSSYTYIHHDSSTSNSNLYLRNTTATGTLRLGAGGTDRVIIDASGHMYPNADGTQQLGGSLKWKDIRLAASATNCYGLYEVWPVVILNSNGMTSAPGVVYVKEARYKCTVINAYARRTGGTGATVNARRAGADIRSADLSLTTTSWTGFGTLQNTSFTDGQDFDIEIATVAGSPTQIVIYLVVRREV
jgi:hypothetical protein